MAPLEPARLDDALRGALHARAATLDPLVDPWIGVERRARGLRRRRVAASVAGTALAVLAIAGAVPLLTPERSAAPGPSDLATSVPSASSATPSIPPLAPTPAAPAPTSAPATAGPVAPADLALDPGSPWAYRGDPAMIRGTQLSSLQQQWRSLHPGSTAVPLFGELHEPSERAEVVLVATGPDGPRTAIARSGEAGWEFSGDEPLEPDTRALAYVLPGDEGADRLLVVTSPRAEQVQYARNGGSWSDLSRTVTAEPGVAVGSLPQDLPDDRYRVLGADGAVLWERAVPGRPAGDAGAPANVLTWPTRGPAVDGALLLAARSAYAESRRATADRVQELVLFSGAEGERRYLLGQFWLAGDERADTVGIVRAGTGEVELQLKQPADTATQVLVLHLTALDGGPASRLVVVPQPGTGQVLYAPDEASEWSAEGEGQDGLDGVVLVGRNPAAERPDGPVDRLRLLDGDGRTTFTGTVASLLCGRTSCS